MTPRNFLRGLSLAAVLATTGMAAADAGGAPDVGDTGGTNSTLKLEMPTSARIQLDLHQNLDVATVDGKIKDSLDKISEGDRAGVLRSAEVLFDLAAQRWLFADDENSPQWAAIESNPEGQKLLQAIAKHIEPFAKSGKGMDDAENPFVEKNELVSFIIDKIGQQKDTLVPVAKEVAEQLADYHFDRNFGGQAASPIDGATDLDKNGTVGWEDARIADIVNASGTVVKTPGQNVTIQGDKIGTIAPVFTYVELDGVSQADAKKMVEKLGDAVAQVTDVKGKTHLMICTKIVNNGTLQDVFGDGSYLTRDNSNSDTYNDITLDLAKLAKDAGVTLKDTVEKNPTLSSDRILNTALMQECISKYFALRFDGKTPTYDYSKVLGIGYNYNGDLSVQLVEGKQLGESDDTNVLPIVTFGKNLVTADVLTQDALDMIATTVLAQYEASKQPIRVFAADDDLGNKEFEAIFKALEAKGVKADQLDPATIERATSLKLIVKAGPKNSGAAPPNGAGAAVPTGS